MCYIQDAFQRNLILTTFINIPDPIISTFCCCCCWWWWIANSLIWLYFGFILWNGRKMGWRVVECHCSFHKRRGSKNIMYSLFKIPQISFFCLRGLSIWILDRNCLTFKQSIEILFSLINYKLDLLSVSRPLIFIQSNCLTPLQRWFLHY